jgi:hypothetical protein
VLDAFDTARLFSLRVGDADLLVELLVDRDIDELVDGGGNDCAAEASIEHGQVGPAAAEAHAKRGAADDHVRAFRTAIFREGRLAETVSRISAQPA